jgi:hypothetical protein
MNEFGIQQITCSFFSDYKKGLIEQGCDIKFKAKIYCSNSKRNPPGSGVVEFTGTHDEVPMNKTSAFGKPHTSEFINLY